MNKLVNLLLVFVLVASTFVHLGTAQAADNLVVNGSFEYPVLSSGQWALFESADTDWQIDWLAPRTETPKLEIHNNVQGNLASDGNQYAELDSNASISIYQDLATCEGGSYDISYAWAPRQNRDSAIEVYWDGELVAYHSGTGASGALNWTVSSQSKTASSDTTRLRINEVGTSDSFGMYFDNVVVTEAYCPPYDRTAQITSPSTGQTVTGLVSFDAVLDDEDGNDSVQWAVRQGTCAAGVGTVLGNVDGHNDSYDWDGYNFHSQADVSSWADGSYCFIFNPTESSGDIKIRETLEFFVSNPPVDVNQCKQGGWQNFTSPTFKNQGDCVSWLQSNENAKGNRKDN